MVRPLLPLCLLFGCATTAATVPAANAPSNAAQSRETSTTRSSTPFVSPHSYEYYIRAEVLAQRGDWAGATAAYDQALSGAEVDAYLLTRYARALDHQGVADDAFAALSEARELSPNASSVHTELANYYARHGDSTRAFGEYERALALAPYAIAPALALANLLDKQGAHDRANATLQRFIESNREFGAQRAQASLVLSLKQRNADAVVQAVQDLRELAQVNPAHLAKAAKLLLQEDRALQAALLLQPAADDPSLLQIRLQVYLAAQWLDPARDLLVRYPEDQLGGFPAVAQALLDVGLPDRALESAAAAKLTQRNDPGLADHAALLEAKALLDLGEPMQAAQSLRSIPRDSALANEALQLRVEALQQAGLPALAEVVADRAGGGTTSQ